MHAVIVYCILLTFSLTLLIFTSKPASNRKKKPNAGKMELMLKANNISVNAINFSLNKNYRVQIIRIAICDF